MSKLFTSSITSLGTSPAVLAASPALGVLELNSIALGYAVTDVLVKKAPVHILQATTVHPGKFLILFCGQVAETEEALQAGLEKSGSDSTLDSLLLPFAHAQLVPAIQHLLRTPLEESLGVVETLTVASTLAAADQSVKAANVQLVHMQLADDLGGKAYYVFTGPLEEVQAAVLAGTQGIAKEKFLRDEIIARPHEDSMQYWKMLLTNKA